MKNSALFILLLLCGMLVQACTGSEAPQDQTTPTIETTTEDAPSPDAAEGAATESSEAEEEGAAQAGPVDYYICYKQDDGKMAMSISFDAEGNAISVKYKGQTQDMKLTKTRDNYIEGGAHPTIELFYDEILAGKVNGSYKLTHSGNWDYAEYTRNKDGKKFNFTIDHDLSIEGDSYRTTACF